MPNEVAARRANIMKARTHIIETGAHRIFPKGLEFCIINPPIFYLYLHSVNIPMSFDLEKDTHNDKIKM
jgi:hypothetical protein